MLFGLLAVVASIWIKNNAYQKQLYEKKYVVINFNRTTYVCTIQSLHALYVCKEELCWTVSWGSCVYACAKTCIY